jgi:hypothetical protein
MNTLKKISVTNTKLSKLLAVITIDPSREPELRRVLAEIKREANEYLKTEKAA